MKSVGIICEYNPFHNGHLYHLEKTKELFPNHTVILILNGYFMQRGELSILTKEDKTKLALEMGINIVVELPFVFGTQASDIFAYNSIKLLNELKVDSIVFGSELNNESLLEQISDIQLTDPNYQIRVKKYLEEGINYPTAMSKALNFKKDINSPNDLLGISYVKAIKQINPKINYKTIKRTNDYHDTQSNEDIVSASNIREKIKNNISIKKFVPQNTLKYLTNINSNYFELLKHKIITDHDLSKYLTVDEGIENRLVKYIYDADSLDEFINLVKTKRYTYNKLNRMFIHILIGLLKTDVTNLNLDYLKILGFDTTGRNYLNEIKKDIEIEIHSKKTISKISDYELKASNIYDLITNKETYNFEIKNKPIEK